MSFIEDLKSFASEHKVLSALTFGAAPLVGVLLGRLVIWVEQLFGTAEKTNTVAQAHLKQPPIPVPRPSAEAIAKMDRRISGIGEDHCIRVSDNGNCLYEAFSVGLKYLKNIEIDPSKVREIVADTENELREEDMMLSAMIGSFETEKEAILENLREQHQSLSIVGDPAWDEELTSLENQIAELENLEFNIDEYIQHTRTNQVFGGAAELYALSQVFPVTLVIFEKRDDGSIIPRRDCSFGDGNVTLKLLLHKKHFEPYFPPGS